MDKTSPGRERPPELENTLTHSNLEASLTDDARLGRLYRTFARVAEIEGYPELTRALRELAEQQEFFADGHVDFLRRVPDAVTRRRLGDTLSNLASAVATEQLRAADTLPEMARTAHNEGFPDIASWFESLAHARRAHAQRLAAALEQARRAAE